MTDAPIRYSMNLVFESSAHMSVSHAKRAVIIAIQSEVGHSEPDDPFHYINRDSIQVLRISAVAANASAKLKEPSK